MDMAKICTFRTISSGGHKVKIRAISFQNILIYKSLMLLNKSEYMEEQTTEHILFDIDTPRWKLVKNFKNELYLVERTSYNFIPNLLHALLSLGIVSEKIDRKIDKGVLRYENENWVVYHNVMGVTHIPNPLPITKESAKCYFLTQEESDNAEVYFEVCLDLKNNEFYAKLVNPKKVNQ